MLGTLSLSRNTTKDHIRTITKKTFILTIQYLKTKKNSNNLCNENYGHIKRKHVITTTNLTKLITKPLYRNVQKSTKLNKRKTPPTPLRSFLVC